MKLEDQVCSLDLAKKLKTLGVKQKSYFKWLVGHWKNSTGKVVLLEPANKGGEDFVSEQGFSAFTCSELGEMLPEIIKGHTLIIRKSNNGQGWLLAYRLVGHLLVDDPIHSTTEADARAAMLCYLIENKLLRLKEDRKK